MFVSAGAAALEAAGLEYVILNPSDTSIHGQYFRSLGRDEAGPVVLIDDCDRCPAVRDRLMSMRSRLSGFLLTASSVGPDVVQQMSRADDVYVALPHLQQRPNALVLLASDIWAELTAAGPDLSQRCDDSATAALVQGPFVDGARSLRQVLESLLDQMVADGDFAEGRIGRRITRGDVATAIVSHMAPRFAPVTATPQSVTLVCEGDTDVTYLRAAAESADAREWHLLEGIEVEAAGGGRTGGAEAVTTQLLLLRSQGSASAGLYDNDEVGRRAAKRAKDLGLERLILPSSLDPLRRPADQTTVEVEDLLPVDVLVNFYMAHPHLAPQERHWVNGYWRVVPKGDHKQTLANWVDSTCHFTELEGLVYLLCLVRRTLRLPLPTDVPHLAEWETAIRERQVKDPTAGLPPNSLGGQSWPRSGTPD
jgi:hypothetical protein